MNTRCRPFLYYTIARRGLVRTGHILMLKKYMPRHSWLIILCLVSWNQQGLWSQKMDREHFVYAEEIIPDIRFELRYFTHQNFVGRPVDGYDEPVLIMTRKAAEAVAGVQEDLRLMGYSLKVFDAYRPQKAVNHFIRWSKVPGDTISKRLYYPDVDKKDLFSLGYISTRSGHSRGSTLDLTIVSIDTEEELDMGGPYDFFGTVSHHSYTELTKEQLENRKLLKSFMEKHGFRAYSKEWWHYTLRGEPFPDTYFDFNIE